MYLASIRSYSLTEQPEEKDEVVMEGLALLKELEADVLGLKHDSSCDETPFEEVQSISRYNYRWLEWALENFHIRFAFKENRRIFCATCGYGIVLSNDADFTDEVCPVCGARCSFGY